LLGMIIGTYAAKPTDEKVLLEFYKRTRPFGFWGPVRRRIAPETMAQINKENRRDILSTFFAVPWQIVLFLTGMTFIMKRWDQFVWIVGALIVLSVALYFNWFRHLSKEVKVN
jgi:SSS family solute:Na+ symporter